MSDLHNKHAVSSISVNTPATNNNNNNLSASEQELTRTKLTITHSELGPHEPLLVGIQANRQEEDDKLAPTSKHHLHIQQQPADSSSPAGRKSSAAARQQQLLMQQQLRHQHHHELSHHQYQSASHQHLQSLMSSGPSKQSSKSAISLLHGAAGANSVALDLAANGQQLAKAVPLDRSDSASLPSSTATSESMFKRRFG